MRWRCIALSPADCLSVPSSGLRRRLSCGGRHRRLNATAIGCILPLSGRNAAYGNKALDAVLLAAGVFNAAKETPIRLLIEDSQSEPAVAGAAVGKLGRCRGHLHPRTAGKPGGPGGGQRGPAPESAHPDPDATGGNHRDRGLRLPEFPDGGHAGPNGGSIRPGGARAPPVCHPLPGRPLWPGDGASLPGGGPEERRRDP